MKNIRVDAHLTMTVINTPTDAPVHAGWREPGRCNAVATVEVVGKFHGVLQSVVAKRGWPLARVRMAVDIAGLGSRPNQVRAGRLRCGWFTARRGFCALAFSGLGAVVVSSAKGGWAADQSGEGGPAAWRLLYSAMGFGVWHSPFARCGDDFRLFGCYRFCHGLRVVGVSPHGRGVLRIV